MYAVIQSGGKQYRVAPGQTLKIEKLDAQEGESIHFDRILMVADGEKISVGSPFVSTATVNAKIVRHGRGDKIRVVKFRRRKNYRRVQGHRQHFTEVEITQIKA